MNPKEVFHNTAYSVQLPYIAGHSLKLLIDISRPLQPDGLIFLDLCNLMV